MSEPACIMNEHSGNARIKRSNGATLAVLAQANFKICWEKSSRKERHFSHRRELPVLAAALLAFCKLLLPLRMVPVWCCRVVMGIVTLMVLLHEKAELDYAVACTCTLHI